MTDVIARQESRTRKGPFVLRRRKNCLVEQLYMYQVRVRAGDSMAAKKSRRLAWPDAVAYVPEFGERYINNAADVSHVRVAGNAILEHRT